MCWVGESKKYKMDIYLGFYGCTITARGITYSPQKKQEYKTVDKETFIKIVENLYTYGDFINAILDCIENGREY